MNRTSIMAASAALLALALAGCDRTPTPAPPTPAPSATVAYEAEPTPADTWEPPIIREDSWYDPTANPENTYADMDAYFDESNERTVEDYDQALNGGANIPAPTLDPTTPTPTDRTGAPVCASANFEQATFSDACEESP